MADAAGEPILEVRDLEIDYLTAGRAVRAVDRVSLAIARGEMLGLAGESGSGKSTIAQALIRVLPPSAVVRGGSIHIAGHDVLAQSPAALAAARWRDVALVMQSAASALNPVLSIGAQIVDAIRAHRPLSAAAARERAGALLARVGLGDIPLGRFPHQLSGGQRQRVAIGMALALDPPLLILDEPTTALDVVVQREILDGLGRLRRELGFAVLFISHDLPLLAERCDRIAVLHRGRVVEQVDAATLWRTPRDPYSRGLLAAVPTIDGTRRAAAPAAPPPDAAARPLLELRGVDVSYRVRRWFARHQVDAVADVSLALARGEAVALVGASGSGKTTLARAIARLVRPTRGALLLDGVDVLGGRPRRATPAYRRRVQLVFQDPYASLNPAHTVGHHLERPLARAHPALSAAARAPRVVALLEAVGLTPAAELAGRFPHELSGGQRQRVAIARALAVDPDVLIADEPTSMLDVSLRLEVLDLLARLRVERGLALVLITHDLASARYLCDRVVVMQAGRVVEELAADRLADGARHPYTRALLDAMPRGAAARPSSAHRPREEYPP